MCGYDPFYWADWQHDFDLANELGFESLDDFYNYVYEQNKEIKALRH